MDEALNGIGPGQSVKRIGTEQAAQRISPGHVVWRLATKWRVAVDRALVEIGLTHAQYVVLASLSGMQAAGRRPSQRELSEETGLEPLYVSKLVRPLEADGLIARTRDPADSRIVRLALTPRGDEVVRPAIDVVQRLLERLLAPLGGRRSPRTLALVTDLQTLLAVPLDPERSRRDA